MCIRDRSSSSSVPPSHSTSTSQQSNSHPPLPTDAHSTKQKQSHVPVTKQNSPEGSNHSSSVLQVTGNGGSVSNHGRSRDHPPPGQQILVGGNRTPNYVGIAAPSRGSGHSWIVRPVLLPNHPVAVVGVPAPLNRTQQHHQVLHTSNPTAATLSHNGLMRTMPPQNRLPTAATIVPARFVSPQPGGLVVCPPVSVNHIQGSPAPAMCFNCGKRGHLGNSCPGVTMETHNPDSKTFMCHIQSVYMYVQILKVGYSLHCTSSTFEHFMSGTLSLVPTAFLLH